MEKYNVAICGAGIAGISTAYYLAVKFGISKILLIDERDPLSLTSDKSTECYRNWWPGPGDAMVSLMNRSIDLLGELAQSSQNSFHLNRRGYIFFTANPDQVPVMRERAQEYSALGAGPLRIYSSGRDEPHYQPGDPGFSSELDGADLILDPQLILQHYPYINDQVCAALHVRRAGWFSAQQMGSLLLERCKQNGVMLLPGRVEGIEVESGKIESIRLESGEKIRTHNFVNAAGPFIQEIAHSMDIHLPIFCEPHYKVSINDHLKIIPRDAPLLIWSDAQHLTLSSEEKGILAADEDSRWLLEEFPPGVHTRPEGGPDSPIALLIWEYHTNAMEPILPMPEVEEYPLTTLRGLSTMIPELKRYFDKPPRPFVDGGYYTKTTENRPLIGPMSISGSWLIGALSGFGLMAAMAAGELLALHVLRKPLPHYADSFLIERYDDPSYLRQIEQLEDTGQL